MQVSSDAFATVLGGGAKHASRVGVYSGTKIKEDTYYGGDSLVLIAESSKVDYDRLSDTRTTAELTFLVRNTDAQDLIDPVNYPEVAVYSGVQVGSTIEWIDLGIMGIFDVSFDRTGHGVFATCQCGDRSTRIRDNAWKKPYQISAGIDYYAGIQAIVADRARGFTADYNIGSNALVTPSLTFSESDDPWAAVLKLAQAVGAEAYFDRQGSMAAFPITDPKLIAPSLVIRPDTTGVLITPVKRQYSNRDVFNGVICKGEAPWLLFPVYGEIWDEDPISPSYRLGPFGEKPKVIGDALATTDAQCLAAATAEFFRIAGVIETISFQTVKDPRLEVGDVIDQLDNDLNFSGRYVLDTYNYPLGMGSASGVVRRKR